MQYDKVILAIAALTAGCFAAPTPSDSGSTGQSMVMYGGGQDQNNGGQNGQSSDQGSQQLGSGGHTMSDLQCSDPSGGGGTTTALNTDLDALINTLDAGTDYCVVSDGSTVATGKGNWSLVNGKCGNDNSAIWLQSYNQGQWCLKGDVIANFARTIVLGCQSNGDHRLYGSLAVDGGKQWVEVGKSAACNLHG